jgi:hypothetical protein
VRRGLLLLLAVVGAVLVGRVRSFDSAIASWEALATRIGVLL